MDNSKQQNESRIRNKKANMGEQSTAKNITKDGVRLFPVFTIKMVNYLCKKGYEIKSISDNDLDTHYKVVYFEDSKNLRKDIREFTTLHNQEN